MQIISTHLQEVQFHLVVISYEPQCEVNIVNQTHANVDCYRNGKTVTASGSLKNGKKIESEYVKVEYDKHSKLPMLNVTYE